MPPVESISRIATIALAAGFARAVAISHLVVSRFLSSA